MALQREVLSDTLSARLGPGFNTLFHQTMLAEAEYYCDGCFVDGALVGYLSYAADTQRLLRTVLRRHAAAYVASLGAAMLRSPRAFWLVCRVVPSMAFRSADPAPSVAAELLSVGVLRAFRGVQRTESGSGASVADLLLRGALTTLRARGVGAVKAISKREEADPIPSRFFRKHGFTRAGPVTRFGSPSDLHIRRLDQSTPPEPIPT